MATDDLNRTTPTNVEAGNRKKNKYVGLFYFLNHADEREHVIHDVTKIFMEQGLDELKTILPNTLRIYWAEPYFGYYLNTDTWVYRKHAYMFNAAGIDFIFIDFSNNIVYEEGLQALLETWLRIRKEGGDTPQVVFMTGDMPHVLVHDLYVLKDLVFNNPEYDELWFKWDGKPLILGNNDDPDGDVWTISEETVGTYTKEMMFANLTEAEKEFYNSGEFGKLLEKFTVRKSWARQSRKYEKDKKYAGYWDWLDEWPQAYGRSFKGVKEQMSVSIAATAMTHKGRSYVKGNVDYGTGLEDFDFSLGKAQYGLHFEEQFQEALKADPDVIMITGWNEWTAGKQTNPYPNMRTGHTSTPYYHFVDQFNPEFSRNAEPMKVRDGVGFGDNYYYQMVNHIRLFKGIEPIKGVKDMNGISFDGIAEEGEKRLLQVDEKIMSQWDKIEYRYMDSVGDTAFRNFNSMGSQYRYINATGRNDIDYAKVTQDDYFLYFMVKTASGIISVDEENWMNLFVDIDKNHETGWEGYDFVINRSRDGKIVIVEKFVNNSWEFETVGRADYLMGSDNLTIKVSKELLGISENDFSFDFKWADNSTNIGNVMQFMDLGDCAPNDRFNFRFTTTDIQYKPKALGQLNYVLKTLGVVFVILIAIFIYKKVKVKGERK